MPITTRLENSRLVGLIAQLSPRSQAAVDETANAIRDRASVLAPRRTGALSASIYVSHDISNSDYSQRAGTARSLNPDAQITQQLTPETAQTLTGSGGGYTVLVSPAVAYGIFNELGTRFMAPQPFMFPAVEPERDQFVQRMSNVARV